MKNQFDPNNEFNQQTEEFNQLGSEFPVSPQESFTAIETVSVEEIQPQTEIGTETQSAPHQGKRAPRNEPTKIAKMMNRFFIVSTTVITSIIAVAVFFNTRVNIINYHVGVDFVSYHIELVDIGDFPFQITLEGVGDKRSNEAVEGINEGYFMNLKPETYYTLKVEGDSEFGYKVYDSVRFKTEPLLSKFNRVNLIKDQMLINKYNVTLDVLVDGFFIAELKGEGYYNSIYLEKGVHDYVFDSLPSNTQLILRVYEFIEPDYHDPNGPNQPHPRPELMEKVEVLKEVTSLQIPIDINSIYSMGAENTVYLNLEYADTLPELSNVEIVYFLNQSEQRIGLDYQSKPNPYPITQIGGESYIVSAHIEYMFDGQLIKSKTVTLNNIIPPIGNVTISSFDRLFQKLITNIDIEHFNNQKVYTLEIVENGTTREIINLNDKLTETPGSTSTMMGEIELTNINTNTHYQLILKEDNELFRREFFIPDNPADYLTITETIRSGSNEEYYNLDIDITPTIEIIEMLNLELEIRTPSGTDTYNQVVNFDIQTHSFDVDAPYTSEYRIMIKDLATGEHIFYDSGFIVSKNANRILKIDEMMFSLEDDFSYNTYLILNVTRQSSILESAIEYTITSSNSTTPTVEGITRVVSDRVRLPDPLEVGSIITLKPYQGIDFKDYDEEITLELKRTAKILSVYNMNILNSPAIILDAPNYELDDFIVEFRDLNDEIIHELVPNELTGYQDYRMHQASFEFTPNTSYKVRLKDVDNMYYGDEQTYNGGVGINITNIVFTDVPGGGSTISFDYELIGDYSDISLIVARYGSLNDPDIIIEHANGEPRTGRVTSQHAVTLENRSLEIQMESSTGELKKVIPLN